MPRVLIDLRCLETESGRRGIGRYTRELAAALVQAAPRGMRLAGLSRSGRAGIPGIEDVRDRGPKRGISLADRFFLPRLFQREAVDLYHSPAYPLPSGGASGVALVLTVHDLLPDLYPEVVPLRQRVVFRRLYRSAAMADRVITVSETTRRELTARYPVDPARVVAVPNGVPDFAAASGVSPGSGFPTPFLLYVGGLDPLKNVPFLLDVLATLRRDLPTMGLVIAGEEGPRQRALRDEVVASGLAGSVHLAGWVEDPLLAAAYREAAAFVFPSRYEGFGLPPLEAMAQGCPVVSSPGGALREVLEGAACLCDPDDAPAWAREILALQLNPGAREARVAAGRARAAAFTWRRSATATLEVYHASLAAGAHP